MLFKTLKRRLCTEEIGILESLSASKTPLRTHEVCTTTETLRSFVPQASLIHILFEAGTWPWRSLWYGNKHVSFSTLPAWPNGYGVPLLRVRLWVRVPSWVAEACPPSAFIDLHCFLLGVAQWIRRTPPKGKILESSPRRGPMDTAYPS